MMSNLSKSSAYRTVSFCFFVSFSFVVEVIFSSKSPRKSSKKMFPFNVQLSCNNLRFLRLKCYFVL